MSRHRFVRNLDVSEELHADPTSSDEYDDVQRGPESYPGITPEQRVQMDTGLVHVRELLGSEFSISDRDIREALWDSYFDVDGTVDWFIRKHEEDQAEVARKEKEKQQAPVQEAEVVPPLSALQRLSLASRDGRANKEKVSLSSLARKSQHPSVPPPLPNSPFAPKTSLQSLVASKVSASAPSTDSPSTSSSKSSILARKAAAAATAGSPIPNSSSISTLRQSKLSQKILKSQSANRSAIYKPPSSQDLLLTEKDAAKEEEREKPSSLTKSARDLFPVSPPSSSKSADELERLSGCAATSTSEFASILVQAQPSAPLTGPSHKSIPISKGADALSESRGIFVFNSPSPDDIVMRKRAGTKLARRY